MAQYRKKPVVIDAEQFFYDGPRVRGVFYPDLSADRRTWIGDAFVITIHDQRVYLQSGDWIIAEPDGEHYYPVKPDIFAASYEPMEGDMFARGEMASSPAVPGNEPARTDSEGTASEEADDPRGLLIAARVVEEMQVAVIADLRRRLADAQAKVVAWEATPVPDIHKVVSAVADNQPVPSHALKNVRLWLSSLVVNPKPARR